MVVLCLVTPSGVSIIWHRQNYKARYYESCRRLTEIASKLLVGAHLQHLRRLGRTMCPLGSLAGMRLLHRLKQHLGERLSIWPFDDIVDGKTDLVLVEIFPSLYFYRLGMVSAKKAAADPAFLNRALAAYDSEGVKPSFTPMGNDADEADAIISAAALRYFSIASGFTLPAASMAIARREGGFLVFLLMSPVKGCSGITLQSGFVKNYLVWHKALICHFDSVF